MAKHNITFVVFTYNEESRIERVIKNFKDFGDILIADNKSTDRTQEIARSYGCNILVREKNYVYVENQELVDQIFNTVKTDWIYWAFADEMLEKETLIKITEVIAADKHDIINMDRKNYFYGAFCYDIYHSYTFKVFKKGAIDFTNNPIHGMGEAMVPNNRICKMPDKYFIHHFISNTASSYLNVINRYTDSELDFAHKPNKSLLHLVLVFFRFIFKEYILNKGYRAGFKGIALIQLMFTYSIIKNMKYYELAENLKTVTIEGRNNHCRDEILG